MVSKEQMLKILAIIKIAYPRFDDFRDSKKLAATNELWYYHFKHCDPNVLEYAVHKYIDYGNFPPTISEVRTEYKKLLDNLPSAEKSWQDVMTNIRGYGLYRADEGFSKLDEISKKALDSIGGYCRLCLAESRELERLQEKYFKIYNDLKDKVLENLIVSNALQMGGNNQNGILQSSTE